MNLSSKDIFREIFHAEPEMTCFAPGRVNLIGEHTDYNGGFVFPCALDLGTECSARKRTDSKLRLYSENFSGEGVIEITLDKLSKTGRWIDYPVGVIRAFNSFGYEVSCGADIVFCGNLPDGAGLSSSAALEVLMGVLLRELFFLSCHAAGACSFRSIRGKPVYRGELWNYGSVRVCAR